MAGGFPGARRDAVRLVQKQLNRAGAGIDEDGVWGEETEEAFNRLSGQLLGAGNTPEEEKGTQAAPLNEYDQDLQFARDKAKRLTDAVQNAIGRLDPDYKARLDALERAYAGEKSDIQKAMLSKGMGRSSYSDDIQEDEYEQWKREQAETLEEKKRKLEDLNAEIADIQANLAETEAKINRRKLEAEQKTARSKSGGGSNRGGGTSSSEKRKQWEIDVLQNWYRMSLGAKVDYFEKNWESIYKQSAKVARQMAKDLEEATGRQYIIN